ncbi:MAG TPA: hypothetical protein DD471_14270, partial [Planctomycetes bacterium]|nr:hypothetical protein [Planctomycetota bacterium]
MKKNRVLVTILLIICGFVAYRLLREVPVGHEGARDLPRIENREREEKKTPAAEAGKTDKPQAPSGPVKPALGNVIAGRVVTADARLAIADAIISLLNDPGTKTTTAEDGSFQLAPVAQNPNDLLIRAPGYGVTTRPRVPP